MAESKNPKFDKAFAAARRKFKKTGDANHYTFYFKGEGREGRFTVNLKGETKKDLMAKFAPGSKNTGANYKVKGKDKVRPKLRPKGSTVVSKEKPEVILEAFSQPAKKIKGDPAIAKLQKRIEGARSAAEVREIVKDSGIKIPAAKMTVLLGKLKKAGLFNFQPAKPKPSPKVEKSKPSVKKPNRTTTQRRKMSNAAVVKFFKEMYPSKLANIKIGDIVYFDPNKTNPQGNAAVVMISSKGK
tara:strand:- start:120 stop:845 length:726 start_codon:yes stop_codon:yes gene_type:complete